MGFCIFSLIGLQRTLYFSGALKGQPVIKGSYYLGYHIGVPLFSETSNYFQVLIRVPVKCSFKGSMRALEGGCYKDYVGFRAWGFHKDFNRARGSEFRSCFFLGGVCGVPQNLVLTAVIFL